MKCTVHSNYSQILHKPLNVKPPQPSYQFLHIFVNYYLIFSSTSRTLGGMTQVVRFQSVRDRKKMCQRPNHHPITVRRWRPRDPIYSACDRLSDSRLASSPVYYLYSPCTVQPQR